MNCFNLVCFTIYSIHVKRLFFPALIISFFFNIYWKRVIFKDYLKTYLINKRIRKKWTSIPCDISCQNLMFDGKILNVFPSSFSNSSILNGSTLVHMSNNFYFIFMEPISWTLCKNIIFFLVLICFLDNFWKTSWKPSFSTITARNNV